MTRICLVRHAIHGLVDRVLAGRMPGVHLTAEGNAHAARLAEHFAGQGVIRVLSSPLERCIETATPIAARSGVPLHVEDRLNELDCGQWTGESFPALERDPRWDRWNSERETASIPGGEDMRQVQGRIAALLARLPPAEGGLTVLVSHSDVIKAAVALLLGMPLNLHDRLQIDPASITTVDLWPGGGKIVRMNEEAAA